MTETVRDLPDADLCWKFERELALSLRVARRLPVNADAGMRAEV